MAESAILTLQCEDQKGIVYHISRFIFENGGNIISSRQHREELGNRFFMRVNFDCSGMKMTKGEIRDGIGEIAGKFGMETNVTFKDERKRLAIMVSKYDHCLYEILLRCQYGEINADVACVISNHLDLESVAANFRVPFVYVPVEKGKKPEAEARQLEVLKQHHVDLIVLARYMQILSGDFINHYPNRIINIHHGFLPAFKGARPYHQAYQRGVKLIGATSHYATEDLDDGPIIEQETIRVTHGHSVDHMLALGREIEKRVLAKAVKNHVEDRIMVLGNRTIIFE